MACQVTCRPSHLGIVDGSFSECGIEAAIDEVRLQSLIDPATSWWVGACRCRFDGDLEVKVHDDGDDSNNNDDGGDDDENENETRTSAHSINSTGLMNQLGG